MTEILQDRLPPEMEQPARLPGMAPLGDAPWLRVDEAYGAQMRHRQALLATRRDDVLWLEEGAAESAREVLAEVRGLLPDLGFRDEGDRIVCPDGRVVVPDGNDPLGTLGLLVQEDICLLQKRGDEHVLIGAVLCFPASWTLAEKAGKPLIGIHRPVAEYDDDLAKRVQRLFDGVRVGRPMWRFNRVAYVDPELHQPRLEAVAHRRIETLPPVTPYIRSERQCVVRMPVSGVVVFSIHTYVVAAGGDKSPEA
ncbi:DUF3445 domain-containing protein [Sulfitobacter sp. HNIBRBA3233]|uniref:heme-dependent oxidative N-demethylase family protein n=1 Tax=Sulfitobacter marinivivus TaxID=3158558 RepID=UPI0032E050D7